MLSTLAIMAHLGHELDGAWSGILHPLTGVDHLLAMVAVGILAATLADRRTAWSTPAAFLLGMVAGGAFGMVGVGAGFVETSIALSVILLGGLIAATVRPEFRSSRWIPVLAVGFGLVHGIAHGGELPRSASPLAYVLGFVVVSAALHLSGVLIGTTLGRRPVVRTALAGIVSTAGVAIMVGV